MWIWKVNGMGWNIYIYKPRLVKGVSRMGDELVALGRLTEMINSTRRQLREGRYVAAYLMGDASELGFGLVLWGQRILALESGSSAPCIREGRQNSERETI